MATKHTSTASQSCAAQNCAPSTPLHAMALHAMAPHKVWSGTLAFGLVSIPISLSAAAREDHISFNQLHSACNSRLKQQPMICPACNLAVTKDEIVKGYEVAKDQYVTIAAAELKAAEPSSSHALEIVEFVSASQLDAVYFESSFYVSVAEGGTKAFALIREAMQIKGVVAIGKLFYSGKEHVVAIRPIALNPIAPDDHSSSGGLMLHTLFWGHEVRQPAFPALPEISDKELSMACQLVDALLTTFDPAQYADQYRANLLQLIERKASGQAIDAPAASTAKKPPVSDISDALLASIAAAKSARVSAGGVQ